MDLNNKIPKQNKMFYQMYTIKLHLMNTKLLYLLETQ